MDNLYEIIEKGVKMRASDILLKVANKPVARVDGDLKVMEDFDIFYQEDLRDIAQNIIYSASREILLQFRDPANAPEYIKRLGDERVEALERGRELDLVFSIRDLARIRANLFMQRGSIAIAIRLIPLAIPSIEQLNLPSSLKDLVAQKQGLIIVTGPTGSGKSTTIASLIEHINQTREAHIITIEDPIEYIFEDKKAVICQREVGKDTASYESALRSVLRESPDVIMIGEMRDAETMSVAMMAAEMGHLVLTTLHTISAPSVVDRIVHSFPPHQSNQIYEQLSNTLVGVIAQRLLKHASGVGRIPAVEIMTASPTVKKLIEEGRTGELYSTIKEGSHYGMITMNQSLASLYLRGLITLEEAEAASPNKVEFRQLIKKQ
ncbi:PilT/PilU family type 4a pilus ATPase [bacterium]|nr:PilT/PilU family type 4a pilus ATPase [bacterium]